MLSDGPITCGSYDHSTDDTCEYPYGHKGKCSWDVPLTAAEDKRWPPTMETKSG